MFSLSHYTHSLTWQLVLVVGGIKFVVAAKDLVDLLVGIISLEQEVHAVGSGPLKLHYIKRRKRSVNLDTVDIVDVCQREAAAAPGCENQRTFR